MPIFYNFHLLLATFYTIFGTNILIQCPVPVPVCCMFFVSQKPNIKRSPNGIKTDGELFWNICDFWEVKSTRDGARGGHETGAHAHSRWARPHPPGPLVRWLMPFFGRKKANFWKISERRFKSNRSYGSPDIKETVPEQNPRTQKQRETER